MESHKINAVLAGRDNSLNRTIVEILQDLENIRIEQWPADTVVEKLNNQATGSIDILIADLLSFSKNVMQVVENLSEHESVKAVLAIHIYTNLKPVKRLIDAGALGYLPQDTNERQLLNAIEHLHNGEKYIGIMETPRIGEKA